MQRHPQSEQELETRALNHEIETFQLQHRLQLLSAQADASAKVDPPVVKLSGVIPETQSQRNFLTLAQPPGMYFGRKHWTSTVPNPTASSLPHPPRPQTSAVPLPGTTSNPTQSMFLAPPTIDAFPPFTPPTYQRWKREVRLRMAGLPSATASQFLSKIIAALPPPAKAKGMPYVESTDGNPSSRTAEALITLHDGRYEKQTVSGRGHGLENLRSSHGNQMAAWKSFGHCFCESPPDWKHCQCR